MYHIDLASGIGGFALAAAWAGWTTVGFCEIDPFCQRVLRTHWPDVPIHDDLRTLTPETIRAWIVEATRKDDRAAVDRYGAGGSVDERRNHGRVVVRKGGEPVPSGERDAVILTAGY